jgi:hypothetical protein
MLECIIEILVAFDEAEPNGGGAKASAAPADLFKIDEDCEKLSEKQATEFHNLVAKTLCCTKRARPDTCTCRLPHHESVETRQRRLGQDDPCDETHQGKEESALDPGRQRQRHVETVD